LAKGATGHYLVLAERRRQRSGAVHGYPDLFVVDGSIVPTALSRNSTATISALAERADST
jgi:choline dehydrogenase-like flavoprotein